MRTQHARTLHQAAQDLRDLVPDLRERPAKTDAQS